MSNRGFKEFNENDLLNEEDEFDIDLKDEPYCMCCPRSQGLLYAAILPGIITALHIAIKGMLILVTSSAAATLAQGFLGDYWGFELAAGLTLTGVGLVGYFVPKRPLIALWLLGTVAMAVVYIAVSFSLSASLSLKFLRDMFLKTVNESKNNFLADKNENLTKAYNFGAALGDMFAMKLFNFASRVIIEKTTNIADKFMLILCLKSEFTAFFFGTIPALALVVKTGFVYAHSLDLNFHFLPKHAN